MDSNAQPGAGLTMEQRVLEHLKVSSLGLEKAAAAEKAQQEKQAEVDALIPQVCDCLVEHERITPNQREKLAEMLKDPAKTLELMMKVAAHKNREEQARLGTGVDTPQTKTASVRMVPSRTGGYAPETRESDNALAKGLGVTV